MRRKLLFLTLSVLGMLNAGIAAAQQVDRNFYVFLAIGGSNMEGKASIRQTDQKPSTAFDEYQWERFKKLTVVDSDPTKVGTWTTAYAPIVRPDTKLGILDFMGRQLVKSLRTKYSVGIVPVAIDSCGIDAFSKDQAVSSAYLESASPSIQAIAQQYGGYPYGKLVEMARIAQQSGVIKGIVFHQGESDANSDDWLENVYDLYANLISDLGLSMDSVPFIAGEPVRTTVDGPVKTALEYVDRIPAYFKQKTGKDVAYVISSQGLTFDNNYSFKQTGYNKMGNSMANELLPILERLQDPVKADPNFFIYLGIGQSNMQGKAEIEAQDRESTADFTDQDWARYKKMVVVSDNSALIGEWVTAKPPIVRPDTKLGVTDYFGRYMVKNTDSKYKIGVLVVAVDGCQVETFSKDRTVAQNYINATSTGSWVKDAAAQYGNYPYGKLVEMAEIAQESGVIKGIIYHQGESGANSTTWLNDVYTLYTNLLSDLGLSMDDVPFIAGEPLRTYQGSPAPASGARQYVDMIPDYFKQRSGKDIAYVASSEGLGYTDEYHFSSAGYRTLGTRYGEIMLPLLQQHISFVKGAKADDGPYQIFNLQGQLQENLQPGFNIVSGKKIFLKD